MTLKNDDQAAPDNSSSSSKEGPATKISIGGLYNPPINPGDTCDIDAACTVQSQDDTIIYVGKTIWSLTTDPSSTQLNITEMNNWTAKITGKVNEKTTVALRATYSENSTLTTLKPFTINML